MDFRINETLQIGAVANSAYQVEIESVSLFLAFTIELMRHSKPYLPAPIYRGIETGGRKCLFIFRIHHSSSVGGISESRLPTKRAVA